MTADEWFKLPWPYRKMLVEEAREKGQSFNTIAKRFGVSLKTIKRTYQQANEPVRGLVPTQDRIERDKKICELWTLGYSSGEIAERFGVSRNVVTGVTHRAKLQPSRSPRHRVSNPRDHELFAERNEEILSLWNENQLTRLAIAKRFNVTESVIRHVLIKKGISLEMQRARQPKGKSGQRRKVANGVGFQPFIEDKPTLGPDMVKRIISRKRSEAEPEPLIVKNDLGPGCWYMYGDPLKEFQQCGHPQTDGTVFCEHHVAMCINFGARRQKPVDHQPLKRR